MNVRVPTMAKQERPVPYGANEMRLSGRQWLVVVSVVATCFLLVPLGWQRLEPFEPEPDYRIPYVLSEDYWQYRRWTNEIANAGRIAIVGDSVVWGEYVVPGDTLSQALNQLIEVDQFANAGLNGSHPVALEGLVKHHAGGLRDRPVVLHCNLLWSSSPERDLQAEANVSFNHPRLVPQWNPRIPAYHASADERLGNIIDNRLTFRSWVHHLRIAYFDSLDVHNWSLDHPYANPFRQSMPSLPEPDPAPRHPATSWEQRGIQPQDMPWVEPQHSLQLHALQRTVQFLRDAGSRVFVIVGPFNEHMLTEGSLERYARLKVHLASWLASQQVPHWVPPRLPSDEYGDASHPLASGYLRLARQMLADPSFQGWWVTVREIE